MNFQFDRKDDGLHLKFLDEEETDVAYGLICAADSLGLAGIENAHMDRLKDALAAHDESCAVTDPVEKEIDGNAYVSVAPDKMSASAIFYPPSVNGKPMAFDTLERKIRAAGVKFGTDEEKLKELLKSPEYGNEYVVAEGIMPKQGQPAWVEYFFNTDIQAKPKENEDGSVDYHSLDSIAHVEKGQLLARLHEAVQGEDGYNVQGEVIRPVALKPKKLAYGKKIDISEDKTELHTQVTGHATLVNEKVFVSDVYEVAADVDNSTGDIHYAGSVTVNGNVKSGFTVEAEGDIVVRGVVEGATLKATGQILLGGGIHGMGKAQVYAGQNVIAKFIENADVTAGGYIQSDAILHSQVSAGTEIRVSGKKGLITGGKVRATSRIEAKVIGSHMGAHTVVEVGVDPRKKEEAYALSKELEEIRKNIEKIEPTIMSAGSLAAKGANLIPDEKKAFLKQLAIQYQQLKAEREEKTFAYDELQKQLAGAVNARVIVHSDAYQGTCIVIADVSLNLDGPRARCKFVRDGGEVRMRPL
jgi:hypothetical protein